MRKLIFKSLFLTLIAQSSTAQSNCGLVEHFQMISAQDPRVPQTRDAIGQFTQNLVNNVSGASGCRSVIIIPVVVRVVYNQVAQIISDAQIQSQITNSNQDFRKLNIDCTNTSAVFQGLNADHGTQFGLAQPDQHIIDTPLTQTSLMATIIDFLLRLRGIIHLVRDFIKLVSILKPFAKKSYRVRYLKRLKSILAINHVMRVGRAMIKRTTPILRFLLMFALFLVINLSPREVF